MSGSTSGDRVAYPNKWKSFEPGSIPEATHFQDPLRMIRLVGEYEGKESN